MRTRWKVALGLAALGIICALLFATGRSQPRRELEATRKSLRQQGFKIDLAEFNFSTSPEVRKRASALATTTLAEIKSRSRPSPILRDVPPIMTPIGSGAVVVVWELEKLKRYPRPDLWPEFRDAFKTNRVRLEAACEAACSGPIQFEPIGRGAGALLPYLADLRNIETAFGFRAMLALHDDEKDVAWTNLLASTCLVTSYAPEPLEISHLVRVGCVTIAFETLWNALQWHDWSDAQLAELQSRWERVDFWKGLAEAVACSRATFADAFERERRESLTDGMSLKYAMRSPKVAGEVVSGFWRRIRYRQQGSFQDEKAMFLYYRDRELEVRRAVQCPNWLEMRQLPGVTNQLPFTSTSPSRTIMMMNQRQMSLRIQGQLQGMMGRAAEGEARRRLIVTTIALERYRLAQGSFPNALQELVPKLLSSPPIDFMDGKPLRYHRTEDDHFVLYSIGLDCVDNGGQIRRPTRRGDPYQGPWASRQEMDIVWPRPASSAEVEKFLQDELEAEQERLMVAEERDALEQWNRSARRQAKVESILKTSLPPTKSERASDRRRLAEVLGNERPTGTNQITLTELLTLRQRVTGAEPEMVTFELPINYDVVTNIGELLLLIDPCKDEDSDEGCEAGMMECKRSTNGNCLLVWSTIYESPGEHALQAAFLPNALRKADDLIEGPVIPFGITNLCQFSLTSAHFQREYGVTLRAKLPETNGLYKIDISTVGGEVIRTFTGGTSNGLFTVHWDLLDEKGRLCTNNEFGTLVQITLPASGRFQRLRGP